MVDLVGPGIDRVVVNPPEGVLITYTEERA